MTDLANFELDELEGLESDVLALRLAAQEWESAVDGARRRRKEPAAGDDEPPGLSLAYQSLATATVGIVAATVTVLQRLNDAYLARLEQLTRSRPERAKQLADADVWLAKRQTFVSDFLAYFAKQQFELMQIGEAYGESIRRATAAKPDAPGPIAT
jgi:hypothetical protein